MKAVLIKIMAWVLAASAAAMATGCAVVLIGMGAGAATATYVMGKLTRTYECGHPEAVQASTEALGVLEIPVAERVGDDLKTTIRAQRIDGTPVEIDIKSAGDQRTEIGVRTGHVGVWDQPASRQIHDLIGERLARQSSRESTPPPVNLAAAAPKTEAPAPSGEPRPVKKRPAPKAAANHAAPPASLSAAAGAAGLDPALTVFFNRGSDEFAPAEIEKLDRIAALLVANPAAVASLHGYSDSIGKSSQNFILSVDRADSVKRYLAEKGCPEDQLLVIGHGATKFLGSNETEAGRRLNRRVEIELHNAP